MTSTTELTGLTRLEEAFAAGDRQAIRAALAALTPAERNVLEQRLGPDAVERLFTSARSATRAAVKGKVVLLHGIMGGRLDVESNGDVDRVWLNYPRLIMGRIADLRLPATPARRVQVAGLLPEYMPTVAELGTRWDVLPFAYDWRDDIDKAADDLARRIEAWRGGAPVHLVAHSMGGLVSRWFLQKHTALWKAMQDPEGKGRGGRLVMLGTPNRGSFAIPLVLTGHEKTVKMLARADLRHDMDELLEILGTFPGCYQMLPSHRLEFGDDRARLYQKATWGTLPVQAALLAGAKAFHDRLFPVVDPERLVYVAGYDRSTPYRIRVDGPGGFSYQETMDGDGRVPHELGLLDGVRTLWVDETHGDLQRNAAVLDGIHELLETGDTAALEHARPQRRAVPKARAWKAADAVEVVPEEILAALAKPVARGRKPAAPAVGAEEAALREAEIASEWVGSGIERTRGRARAARGEAGGERPARRGPRPHLAVEVVWGDITRAEGDVYVAGHYENVLPQFAELALDRAVSEAGDLMLTRLTRQGVLRGALGDVYFFPWAGEDRNRRTASIAGMGRPGSFGWFELCRLARNLTWAVTSLPGATTVCTVLIGAGAGNLKVDKAVDGLVAGMAEALAQLDRAPTIRRVRLVEMQLFKAVEIHRALERARDAYAPQITLHVEKDITDGITAGEIERLGDEPCLTLALAAMASAAGPGASRDEQHALATLLDIQPRYRRLVGRTKAVLRAFAPKERGELRELAHRLTIGRPPSGDDGPEAPTRISFVSEGSNIRCAAISDTAVIQERRISLDESLIAEAVRDMSDPRPDQVPRLSKLLLRLVLPRDFRELLEQARSIVFEVDRTTARIHWEMIARKVQREDATLVAQTQWMARQLRTEYSPPPAPDRPSVERLRGLVIGDPGDPAEGMSLPGACEEAVAVHALLTGLGVEVTTLIGAPGAKRPPQAAPFKPAPRLEVLAKLMDGDFDILHYAGHGGWDDRDPDRTGWMFKGGILSSRELERVDLAPRLVVANACLSAKISDALRRGETVGKAKTEAELLPGLADEFFRRGVRNYVGTAWEISDIGAIEFSKQFYEALLGQGPEPSTIGAALLKARKELFDRRDAFGSLWAAYQHYGDPSAKVKPAQGTDAKRGGKAAGGARPAAARAAKKRRTRRARGGRPRTR